MSDILINVALQSFTINGHEFHVSAEGQGASQLELENIADVFSYATDLQLKRMSEGVYGRFGLFQYEPAITIQLVDIDSVQSQGSGYGYGFVADYDNRTNVMRLDRNQKRQTILHELNHAIDDYEADTVIGNDPYFASDSATHPIKSDLRLEACHIPELKRYRELEDRSLHKKDLSKDEFNELMQLEQKMEDRGIKRAYACYDDQEATAVLYHYTGPLKESQFLQDSEPEPSTTIVRRSPRPSKFDEENRLDELYFKLKEPTELEEQVRIMFQLEQLEESSRDLTQKKVAIVYLISVSSNNLMEESIQNDAFDKVPDELILLQLLIPILYSNPYHPYDSNRRWFKKTLDLVPGLRDWNTAYQSFYDDSHYYENAFENISRGQNLDLKNQVKDRIVTILKNSSIPLDIREEALRSYLRSLDFKSRYDHLGDDFSIKIELMEDLKEERTLSEIVAKSFSRRFPGIDFSIMTKEDRPVIMREILESDQISDVIKQDERIHHIMMSAYFFRNDIKDYVNYEILDKLDITNPVHMAFVEHIHTNPYLNDEMIALMSQRITDKLLMKNKNNLTQGIHDVAIVLKMEGVIRTGYDLKIANRLLNKLVNLEKLHDPDVQESLIKSLFTDNKIRTEVKELLMTKLGELIQNENEEEKKENYFSFYLALLSERDFPQKVRGQSFETWMPIFHNINSEKPLEQNLGLQFLEDFFTNSNIRDIDRQEVAQLFRNNMKEWEGLNEKSKLKFLKLLIGLIEKPMLASVVKQGLLDIVLYNYLSLPDKNLADRAERALVQKVLLNPQASLGLKERAIILLTSDVIPSTLPTLRQGHFRQRSKMIIARVRHSPRVDKDVLTLIEQNHDEGHFKGL